MKTKHFIEEVERQGYLTQQYRKDSSEHDVINIHAVVENMAYIVARVFKTEVNCMLVFNSEHVSPVLFSLLYRYASTPIYKREDKYQEEVENVN